MVDNRVGMNICTPKLVIVLGFFEACIDWTNTIVIKAYENFECSFEGLITLLIRAKPTIQNTMFHFLDLDFP